MDYKQMTAPCGLDCFNCPAYLAKDNEKKQEVNDANTGASQGGYFVLDAQGEFLYSPSPKKQVLINKVKAGKRL